MRSLISLLPVLLERMIAIGSYAIVSIEQQIHAADDAGKIRPLTALHRIGEH